MKGKIEACIIPFSENYTLDIFFAIASIILGYFFFTQVAQALQSLTVVGSGNDYNVGPRNMGKRDRLFSYEDLFDLDSVIDE